MLRIKWSVNDEYYTPACAVYPIIPYLKPGTTVWCPFDMEESQYVKVLSENGFTVIHGHVETGQDFFKMPVPDCDYIVSNPPYSMKSKIIRRLYEIGKPFAMLVNFQGIFDSKERFQLFKENKVEMLWLSPRVSYIRRDGKPGKRVPFQSGYICSGICGHQLEFEYLSQNNY